VYKRGVPVTRKPLHFLGSSLDDLRAFPEEAPAMPDSIWTSFNAAWTPWTGTPFKL
jgi:hypothetical protein